MKGSRFRQPGVSELANPLPRRVIPLASPPERAPPEFHYAVTEGAHLPFIRWNGMIGEIASDDLAQPSPLLGDWLMHPPPELFLNLLEFRPHAVASCPAMDAKLASQGPAANEGEA